MYDAPYQRVKKVSITLECTPGSHQTQCEAQEGACPERKDAILQGERDRSIALGALEGRFWLPGSSVCIGSRAPAQGVHPSAVEALGVRNADLPGEWSLPTTPSPKPHGPRSTGARAERPR